GIVVAGAPCREQRACLSHRTGALDPAGRQEPQSGRHCLLADQEQGILGARQGRAGLTSQRGAGSRKASDRARYAASRVAASQAWRSANARLVIALFLAFALAGRRQRPLGASGFEISPGGSRPKLTFMGWKLRAPP